MSHHRARLIIVNLITLLITRSTHFIRSLHSACTTCNNTRGTNNRIERQCPPRPPTLVGGSPTH